MDREIKFRVWNPVYGMGLPIGIFEMTKFEYDDGNGVKTLSIEYLPESVFLQYTGLKDKNGKEIYEGDILKGGIVIIWRQDLASFALSKIGWMHDHYFGEAVDPGQCVVIGNRFENPELLNNG